MKYRILTTNHHRWGEGWKYGDIVAMDFEAARVPLQKKEIEPVNEQKEEVAVPMTEERLFVCPVCEKVCKNKLGLIAHQRSHK